MQIGHANPSSPSQTNMMHQRGEPHSPYQSEFRFLHDFTKGIHRQILAACVACR